MWIRTQDGKLLNLDNVVAVRKTQRMFGDPAFEGVSADFKVIAVDASPENVYTIASGLTEENADAIMRVIWRSIPAEDSLDVSMLVKS